MTIDITKFLALTVTLAAGTVLASACTVTDDEPIDGTGGAETGGAATTGGAGGATTGGAGGATNGGATPGGANAGGATPGGATAGGAATGGASPGGASAGGAATGGIAEGGAAQGGAVTAGGAMNGGAGGAGGGGECLSDDPTFELDCATGFSTTDCYLTDPAFEGFLNFPADACSALMYTTGSNGSVRPGVQAAAAACLTAITADPCSAEAQTAAAACRAEAGANACENPLAVAACGTADYTDSWSEVYPGLLASCDALDVDACVAALNSRVDPWAVAACMDPLDPSGEYYDPLFAGTCVERFALCSAL